MSERVVATEWKQADMTPIFENSTTSDPEKCRPVSLTTIPCRDMEACIRDNIVKHLGRTTGYIFS